MTVNDLLKRLNKMPKNKMVIFHDGKGWSNIDIKEKEYDVHITSDCNSPFTDGG